MADIADAAEQTIELELSAQIAAIRKKTGPQLEAIGVCHNCGDEIAVGTLFCAPLGAGLSECQMDYERRAKRGGV
jgi:RNA polymerase-binding transcription factor DksA